MLHGRVGKTDSLYLPRSARVQVTCCWLTWPIGDDAAVRVVVVVGREGDSVEQDEEHDEVVEPAAVDQAVLAVLLQPVHDVSVLLELQRQTDRASAYSCSRDSECRLLQLYVVDFSPAAPRRPRSSNRGRP